MPRWNIRQRRKLIFWQKAVQKRCRRGRLWRIVHAAHDCAAFRPARGCIDKMLQAAGSCKSHACTKSNAPGILAQAEMHSALSRF